MAQLIFSGSMLPVQQISFSVIREMSGLES